VSVVSINGERSYAAFFEKDDGTSWRLHTALTPAQYEAKWEEEWKAGCRATYLSAYQHDGGVRFSAVFRTSRASPAGDTISRSPSSAPSSMSTCGRDGSRGVWPATPWAGRRVSAQCGGSALRRWPFRTVFAIRRARVAGAGRGQSPATAAVTTVIWPLGIRRTDCRASQ